MIDRHGASAPQHPGVRFIRAFETTFHPRFDRDVADLNGHWAKWHSDIDMLVSAGIDAVRYPLRWHRIESVPGVFDFAATDCELNYLRERGVEPIMNLVHHTSYPAWLAEGFRDPRFADAYQRYAEAVALRYPWIDSYKLFNEPFATLFLAGHEALWPPYDHGMEGFVRLAQNVLPALCETAGQWARALPRVRHVWVDTCEHHTGMPGAPARYAELANDRRHVLLDLVLGHDLDESQPFLRDLIDAGGRALLKLAPAKVDVLGLDYYCHSEWWYDVTGGHSPSLRPLGFSTLAQQYWERYRLPVMLTETSLRGLPSDRASWLRDMLEQYEQAVDHCVPLQGFCWFPYVDSCDWDSLLARPAGRLDPVGVLSLGSGLERIRTTFTSVWESAAAGAMSEELPAYRFQPPCQDQLAGLLPLMVHWPWKDPPTSDRIAPLAVPSATFVPTHALVKEPFVQACTADLIVLSHLRWTWVWQRPQQLVSRFAAARKESGTRTWFIEEPMTAEVSAPVLKWEECDGITRVWLEVPINTGQGYAGFDDPRAKNYACLIREFLQGQEGHQAVDVLLYTPLALDIAHALKPRHASYDVMDDLSSFLGAPQSLKRRHQQLLAEADAVFAGGRSLYRSIRQHRSYNCHLFPSGVDTAHYRISRALRTHRPQGGAPVAGYVGVIDERLDLDLVEQLAATLPHWQIHLVGPVAKIDPHSLPQAPNLYYPGMASYADLPKIMAGFDVALMPFALNQATKSISPTKTLEYLASGLPVVSTRVPDVVADYAQMVQLCDDASGFAAACLGTLLPAPQNTSPDIELELLEERHGWDHIAAAMAGIMSANVFAVPDMAKKPV